MKVQKETVAITTLLATGALSLPVLTSGFLAGQLLGTSIASFLISISAAIIATLAGISAYTGSAFKANTIILAKKHFGNIGIIMVAFALAVALTGWFSVQTIFICNALSSLVPMISGPICIVSIGILLTLVRMLGLAGLGIIAAGMSLPLGIVMGQVIMHLPTQATVVTSTAANILLTVGGLLGTTITATLELPILYESIAKPRDAVLSSLIIFGFCVPAIQALGAYIGSHGEVDADIISTLVTSIPGGTTMVAVLIICSGVIANLLNLFSSSQSLKSIVPSLGTRTSIGIAGGAGTLLALLPIQTNLLQFFSLLTVSAGSLSLIMIHTYIMKIFHQSRKILTSQQALIIWLCATAMGIISQNFAVAHQLLNPLITALVITSALLALQPKSPLKQWIAS